MHEIEKIVKVVVTSLTNIELVEVINETENHVGHKHYNKEQVTHIKILIKPSIPVEKLSSILEIHRTIYKSLNLFIADHGLHAISIKIIK